MLPVSLQDEELDRILQEVVQTLAALDRTPCSPGEREAAQWLAARLEKVPGVRVELQDEPSWGTFPPTATMLGLLGVAGAVATLAGRRVAGGALAALGLAGIVDEAQNGPRLARRLMRRRRLTVNVVAEAGEEEGPETLVVLAHHDAPQTGILFDQSLQRRLYELAPERMGKAKTSLPQWWIGLAGPLLTLLGALLRRPALARAGLTLGAGAVALIADIWRSPTVPGANDNLSGVAVLVALAELLGRRGPADLRVMLVSCGAEETLQDGIRAFVKRHGSELDPARTCFVNLDTVGSPHLAMVEGEGPIWMQEYPGEWLRDLLAVTAERLEIPLERGFHARASTDSVIPARAGYPIATLISITDWRTLANYHLPSDIPANLDYATVGLTARLIFELIEKLPAGRPAGIAAAAPS